MKKWILQFLLLIGFFVLLRVFLLELYVVRKNSMQHTYGPGDRVLITKQFFTPGRNDVVIFRQGDEQMIKRCIGLPGDTVEVRKGRLYLNGRELPLPPGAVADAGSGPVDVLVQSAVHASYGTGWSRSDFGPYVVPYRGMTVSPGDKAFGQYAGLLEKEDPAAASPGDRALTYTFRQDYYFLVGDNRPASEDSRVLGPVARAAIRGKVILKL